MSTALILGGTGTLGKQVLPLLFENPEIRRVRILSRGEHTQMEMYDSLTDKAKQHIDFLVGDVRDLKRIVRASKDCSTVFHFAAMKSVDKAEYDPWEAVQTNIMGTNNVIEACIKNGVDKAIFTSSDKAVSPLNIYGASKLVAEKLFVQANIGNHKTKFSVMRYGNVLASNGSVIARWKDAIKKKSSIRVTDKNMTRFFIVPEDAAGFVVMASYKATGGEVFVPKMKSTSMGDLWNAFQEVSGKSYDVIETGIRPGEKMHEVLISEDEMSLTTDCHDHYIRWPNEGFFPFQKRGEPMKTHFSSKDAVRFTHEELKELIQWAHV